MADLHSEFDKEADLSKSFDKESGDDFTAPTDTASMSGSAALGRALLQGAMPFEDRAVAAAKTGLAKLQEFTGINTGANVKPTYEENLAMMRQRNIASQEAHPALDIGGKIAGGAFTVLAEPAAIASKLGISGAPTLANAAKGAAAYGAVRGLSDTADLTDVPQATKDTAMGAIEGAVLGPLLSGTAKGVSTILDRAGKTKMVQSMLQAARVGAKGADVVGSEATANVAKSTEGHILDEFLPRIKKIEQDIVGHTDPTTGQRVMGAYDTLYGTADAKLPQGIDVNGLADKVSSFRQAISDSPAMKAFYEQNGGMTKINSVLDALEQRAGRKSVPMIGAPEGIIAPESMAQPMSVSQLRAEMQNLQKGYEASPENNRALLDLKKLYDQHLDETLNNAGLGDIKSAIDAKYSKLKSVKDMLGIKPGMTGIEPQETARSIAHTFENAAKSEPNALNDVGQVGKNLLDLDPEIGPTLSTMADNAENLSVSKSVNKETPIAQGASKAHLSGHAITSNIGLAGGRMLGAAEELPAYQAIRNLINGASNLANTEPEQVSSIANHMLGSENPITKRMGGLLNQVATEQDPGKRRALMFSLGQQHAFRQAMGNAFKAVTGNEEP